MSDFRAEALRRAKSGTIIDGQKLIYGNKGKRVWTDKKKAEVWMEMLAGPEKIYEPREIISPTQAEKILKKDGVYEALVKENLVTQSEPQLRLVPLDHKGEAVTPLQFAPTQESGLV